MNVPQMQQPGPGMPPGMPQGPGPVPQAPSLMQSSVSQPPAQEKLDNISKVKVLVNQLRESINVSNFQVAEFVIYPRFWMLMKH